MGEFLQSFQEEPSGARSKELRWAMTGDKEGLNLSPRCVSSFLCELGLSKNRDDSSDTNIYLVWAGNAGKILALRLKGRGAWKMLVSIIGESDGKVVE